VTAIKRTKHDRVFSDLIRTRDKWTCQRCGKYYPEGSRQGLDCSHFHGRRNKGLRWDERNAVALDRGCHQYFGEHPGEFRQFMILRLGQQEVDRLDFLARKPTKYTAYDMEVLYAELKKRLAELKEGV